MVTAVLDVNVLVSAAISPRGIPYRLLLMWQSQRFNVIISEHILTQLLLKLRSDRIGRRYGLTTAAIRDFTAPLRRDARLVAVPPQELHPITTDPEDNAVLTTARLGQADYLVTGDAGLLSLGRYEGVEIVSPRTFLELLERSA